MAQGVEVGGNHPLGGGLGRGGGSWDVCHGDHHRQVLQVGAHAGDVQQVDVGRTAEDDFYQFHIVVSWTSTLLNISLNPSQQMKSSNFEILDG